MYVVSMNITKKIQRNTGTCNHGHRNVRSTSSPGYVLSSLLVVQHVIIINCPFILIYFHSLDSSIKSSRNIFVIMLLIFPGNDVGKLIIGSLRSHYDYGNENVP